MAAGALLLFTLMPPAAAQLPDQLDPVAGGAMNFIVLCSDTLLEPTYAGSDEVTCLLQDVSRDSVYAPGSTSGTSPSQHLVTLTAEPRNASANVTGWQVLVSRPFITTFGGDTHEFTVNVKATPLINTQDYDFDLVAHFSTTGGYNATQRVPFNAQVGRYDFALLSWVPGSQSQKADLDQVVTYSVVLQNTGVYPDSYRFSVSARDDLKVTAPPSVYIPPGESRVVNVSVLTPNNKIFELGRGETITIKATSVSGSGVYTTTGILQIRGSYIPLYWIPLLVVGAVSTAIVARGSREARELRKLEKGRPRPVALTPRQQVLLGELRKGDPDAYKTKRRSLDVVYKERLADYRAHRKEREAADREEARLAALELKAQRKARKEKRKADALAQKAARKEAKLAKKAEQKEAKLLKKKEKVLAKARAKLAKKQAKIDKKQAKIDAKAAKAQAKADKAAAREAKKAEKAAKRQKK